MFFFLCVCECSLTSAKSVQPDLFKVSANEASIKGKSKECSFSFAFVSAAWLMQSQCSLIYLKSVQTKRASKGKAKHPLRGPKPLLRPWNAIRLQSSTRSLWLEASVTALETSRAVLYSAGILIIPRSRYFSLPCINQRLELTDDRFSTMAESQLLPFFYSSAMAEMHFFLIL